MDINVSALVAALTALATVVGGIFIMREQLAQARKQIEELRATDLKQAEQIGELKGDFRVRDERIGHLAERVNELRGAAAAGAADRTGGHGRVNPLFPPPPRPPK